MDDDMADLLEVVYGMDEEELRFLSEAINSRFKELRTRRGLEVMAQLQRGSHIRVSPQIRPKRFAGQTGRVLERRGAQYQVELDNGDRVRIPASALEPYDGPVA